MFSLLLLLLLQSTTSILIGTLPNVSYQSNDTIQVTFNGTCQRCICEAFVFNPSPSYVALNCYANENKCDLFYNYSTSYQLVANVSSQFYFYPNLPPLVTFSTSSVTTDSTFTSLPMTSTITTSSTTTCTTAPLIIPACATWNQTGITVAGRQNGNSGSDLASLNVPVDIFIDNNDTLFIVDGTNNRTVKYYKDATSGILVAGNTTTSGSGSNQLNMPKGVAVDELGNVFVADTFNYRIQKFPPNSLVATTVTSNSLTSPLGLLRDVHVDCNGNIYATDSTNNRIVMFYPNSSIGVYIAGNNGAGSAANQFNTPYGCFMDENGTLYVADELNQRIQMWPAGATSGITVAGVTGSASSSSNNFNNPISVVVDNNGYIYVADVLNNRVMKWTMNYTAGGVCIAGCSGIAGVGAQELHTPRDLKFDSSGNLYVSDQGNNRVQKYMIQLPTSNC